MKKLILAILVMVVIGISLFFVFRDKKEPVAREDGPSGIDGNVLEITDKNSVLIEVTKSAGNFDKGDKVIVKYHTSLWMNYENMGEIIPAEIFAGDTVSVQFWDDDVSEGEEHKIISVDSIEKYTDKDENYKELSTEHPNYISGKAVKINDDKSVVVEITKERCGYIIGEKVLVKYDKVFSLTYLSEEGEATEKELQEGNLVEVEAWYNEIEQTEDMDIIKVEKIYINDWYDAPN